MKSKKPIVVFMLIYILSGMGANFAHPITPSYLAALNFPSSMFGLVFATMSFTNFAFSPFWGVMSKYISARKLLLIGSLGYAFGQFLFGFNSSPWIILVGRLISGAFVSAIFVAASYYVISISSEDERASNITKTVTIFSVSGTVGYFLGGYLGTFSLRLPFIIQCLVLAGSGFLFYFFLEDNPVEPHIDINRVWSSSNPLVKTEKALALNFKILFVVVLLISMASTSLTQTFAYYLVNHLNMTSFANGVTKGLVGIGAMVLNLTLTLAILRSDKVDRNIMYLFLFIGLMGIPLILAGNSQIGFAIIGVVMMSFDTMPMSLLQSRNVNLSTRENQGEMLGLHNAMKGLGAIVGSLVASFIYDWSVISPFVLTIVLYLLGVLFVKQLTKINQ